MAPTQHPSPTAAAAAAAERVQRFADVVVAGAALAVTAPVILAAAAAIRLEDGGHVLFRQRRYGRDGVPFTVLKLRTMTSGASSARHERYIAQLAAGELAGTDEASAADHLYKLEADPRVTTVGGVLRRLSIDELPQLVNVLVGQMSIVGPRPALDYELQFYEPRHFERFSVRPGLTGLWQVSGRSRLGFREMLELDVQYARSKSFGLDLRIMLKTPAVLVGHSA